MPRMSKKFREEWSFFINEYGRREYNPLCRQCRNDCKQSYRAAVINCPKFTPRRKYAARRFYPHPEDTHG